MTSHNRKNQLNSVALVVLFLLASCATQESIQFSEIVEKNASLKEDIPSRITVDLDADCDDITNLCEIHADNLVIVTQIITNFNDEVEKRIKAYNSMVDAVNHCEYAGAKKDESIGYLERAKDKTELLSTIKSGLYLALCGASLLY